MSPGPRDDVVLKWGSEGSLFHTIHETAEVVSER